VIDADLGAANLHTVIGVAYPGRTLSDFVNRKIENLEDAVMKTPVPNLFFISGAGDNLDVANLIHSQKRRLLRAISKLPYEHILLDLGPAPPSTPSTFSDLQHGNFRHDTRTNVYRECLSSHSLGLFEKIRQVLREEAFRELLQKAVMRSNGTSAKNPEDMLRILKACDPIQGELLEESLRSFRFKLVLNQLRKQDNHQLGTLICRICEKHLGLRSNFWAISCTTIVFTMPYAGRSTFWTSTPIPDRYGPPEFCHRFLAEREDNPLRVPHRKGGETIQITANG